MTYEGEDDGGGMEVKAEETAPSHHPPPPSSELFNISTTIDPSYIISLIRKILPHGANASSGHGPEHCAEHGQKANYAYLEGGSCCKDDTGDDDMVGNECGSSHGDPDDRGVSTAAEDQWEESGCILWDLAANESHAEFMVENLLLEVLLANLSVSKSARVTAGDLIGNLACHEVTRNAISSTKGFIQMILDQLFLDDSICLFETCRLLTSVLQGSGSVLWAEALAPEHILCRIVWIAGNTLNTQLLIKISSILLLTVQVYYKHDYKQANTEKFHLHRNSVFSVTLMEKLTHSNALGSYPFLRHTADRIEEVQCLELLLAIFDNQEVAQVLLPPLMSLDLPKVLLNLLACEMSSLTVGKDPDRCSALEMVLCVIESLSTIANYSQVISSDRELFRLVCSVVKLLDKIEVASSCITAVVLIANILTDEPTLVSEISQDMYFLQGLLDILPFVSDDSQARSALWSVLAKVLVQDEVDSMSQSSLQQYCSALIDKSEIIEEDIDSHQLEDSSEDHGSSNSSKKLSDSIVTSVSTI